MSRLTKQVFFGRYANLIKQLPNLRVPRSICGDYSEMKSMARDYQVAKRELFDAFRREDLGSWLKKPIEQDNFNVPTWHDLDVIDDGIDTDFIGVDKQFMYAPRAPNPTTKNLDQPTAGQQEVLNTRQRNFERFDKGSLSNKIVVKSLVHRIGGSKRKTSAGFVTFKE